MLMPIVVNPFLDIFTRVTQLFKPVNRGAFTDAGMFLCQIKCGKYDFVNMATEKFWGYGAKILGCKVSPYTMQDSLVIEKGILSVFGTCFCWRKTLK
jgi:hypothetical protein